MSIFDESLATMSANVLKWLLLLGLFGICFPMQISGQTTYPWAKTGGSAGYDRAVDLMVLNDNTILIAVEGSSTADKKFTLYRLDEAGNVLWISENDYPGDTEIPNNIALENTETFIYQVGNVGPNNQFRIVSMLLATGDMYDNSDSWISTTPENSGLSARVFMDATDSVIIYAADGNNLNRYVTDTIGELPAYETFIYPDALFDPAFSINAQGAIGSNIHILAGTTQLNMRPYIWAFKLGDPFFYLQLPTDSIIVASIGTNPDNYIQVTGTKYDSTGIYIALFDTTGGVFNFVMDTLFDLGTEPVLAGQAQRFTFGETILLYTINPGTDSSKTHSIWIDDVGDIFYTIQLLNTENGVQLSKVTLIEDELSVYCAGQIRSNDADSIEFVVTYSASDNLRLPVCAFDCVWPGDADNNGIVDMADLFPIGITYSQTGAPRDSLVSLWLGHKVDLWATEILPDLNTHYADTWGDGLIDIDDTIGIIENYYDTHIINDFRLGGSGFPLWLNTAGLTLTPGYNEIPIMLGDEITSVDAIYALEFNISYEGPPVIDSTSVTVNFDDSWFGTIGEMIQLDYNFPEQHNIDAGATNLDLTNRAGFGQIGRLGFIVEDNIAGILVTYGDSTLTFNINSASAIKNDYTPVDVSTNTYEVTVGIANLNTLQFEQNIFPNPYQNGNIFIPSSNIVFDTYQIIDMSGSLLLTGEINSNTILNQNLEKLVNGTYIIKLISKEAIFYCKLIIFR